MALSVATSRGNIPENARVLSKKEALSHQMNFIKRWDKPSEVFFLKYGSFIAGVTTALSSIPIVHHFRKQFRLNKFGVLLTYVPSSLLPAFLNTLGYNKLVTSDIILMKMQCPLCVQFRYAAYHIGSSMFYSTGIAAMSCATIAINRKTRYVPHPQTEGKLYVKFMWDIIKAGSRRYQAVTAFQLIVALALPYIQVQEFSNLMQEAAERDRIEPDLEDSFSSKRLFQ